MADYTADDVVGAVNLAMMAGADARVRSMVIREILKRGPEPGPDSTAPVRLLIEAIKASNAEFVVTNHEPRGRLARSRR